MLALGNFTGLQEDSFDFFNPVMTVVLAVIHIVIFSGIRDITTPRDLRRRKWVTVLKCQRLDRQRVATGRFVSVIQPLQESA